MSSRVGSAAICDWRQFTDKPVFSSVIGFEIILIPIVTV